MEYKICIWDSTIHNTLNLCYGFVLLNCVIWNTIYFFNCAIQNTNNELCNLKYNFSTYTVRVRDSYNSGARRGRYCGGDAGGRDYCDDDVEGEKLLRLVNLEVRLLRLRREREMFNEKNGKFVILLFL